MGMYVASCIPLGMDCAQVGIRKRQTQVCMQCKKSPSHQKLGQNGKTTWGMHSLLYVKPCPYVTITMFCCWLHSALVCRTTIDSSACTYARLLPKCVFFVHSTSVNCGLVWRQNTQNKRSTLVDLGGLLCRRVNAGLQLG